MSTPTVRGRLASRDSYLRAADADRERIAGDLQTAHAEGRLDLTEFQQRLERCYDSKTLGELGEIVSDLPGRDELLERRQSPRHGPPRILVGLLVLLVLFMALGAATGGHGHHPFFWVLPVAFLIWRMSGRRSSRMTRRAMQAGSPR